MSALREQYVTVMLLAGQARRCQARELKAHAKLIAHAEQSSARLQKLQKGKLDLFTFYAMRLQEAFRLRMARRQMAAAKLQETYHAKKERRHYAEMKTSVVKLQSRIRGVISRQQFVAVVEEKARLQRQAAYARRALNSFT